MSALVFELDVSVRTDTGKGASRRLRRLHNAIPAVLYGADKAPLPLTINHDAIAHATENEAFFSHIITLNIGEKQKELAVIKDLQRHPARPAILHADFLRISKDHAIHIRVPLHFVNEEKCQGVKTGGVPHSQVDDRNRRNLPAPGLAGVHRSRHAGCGCRPNRASVGYQPAGRRSQCGPGPWQGGRSFRRHGTTGPRGGAADDETEAEAGTDQDEAEESS